MYYWLVLFIISLLVISYHTSHFYRLLKKIPAAKGLPVLGHTLSFLKHSDEILNTMSGIFEEPTSDRSALAIWFGFEVFVYVRSIENIEKLLSGSNLKKSVNYAYLKPWLGDGLINSDGETWKLHRKLITPSFHYTILKRFLETMISKTETLFFLLDDKVGKGYFNIEPYVVNYSLDIITETAISSSVDAQLKATKFADAIKSLTEIIILRSVRLWYHFTLLFSLSRYGNVQKECISFVNDFIHKIMNKKKSEGLTEVKGTDEKNRLAMLDLMFEVQSKNPQFTDKEIIDEVNTFMFAGHDTTASGINFVLYLLSVHQDIQERVYEEISTTLDDENITYGDLMGLKYLERVIKESLRLYPSVPYIGRQLTKDLSIGNGYVLPKDCDVAIFIYNHHRNPDIWPEPEKFDPDRFLAENSRERSPYAYMPFSAGPRNCIGQKFAMMEIMLAVSKLLRRYKLIIEPGFKVRPVSHIVLRPDANGVRLKLEKR